MEEDRVLIPKKVDTNHERHFVKDVDEKKTLERVANSSEDQEKVLKLVESSVIGHFEPFHSPFGIRRTIYCDYTASGRALTFIEDFIRDQVLTLYANTHTSTSISGYQSSLFYREAKLYIKGAINANFSKGNKKDCLFFVGSGSTGAVNAVVSMIGIEQYRNSLFDSFIPNYFSFSNINATKLYFKG